MKILGVANSKGGVAKSTLASNVLYTAYGRGIAARGFDCDARQGSLVGIAARRVAEGPLVVISSAAKVEKDLQQAKADGIELAVIDTPGADDAGTTLVLEQVDLGIVPMQPNKVDGEASRATMRSLNALGVPFSLVLSRVSAGREAAAIRFIARYADDDRIAPVHIGQRVAYQDAADRGLGVVEYQPLGRAAGEMRELFDFVWRRLMDTDD